MGMGVVGKPVLSKGFNGKIFLKRVSEEKKYLRTTHNERFSDDATINYLIKDEDWHLLVTDGMTLGDLKDVMFQHYCLDDDIVNRLVIRYSVGKDGRETQYIEHDDESLDGWLDRDITLMVRYNRGDTHVVDISCDSTFMKKTMPEVGKAIRAAYHWVPKNDPIFLLLDNAGGHGTNQVVDDYVKMLKKEFNIECIHQCPRSPCTNMLDLGAWMALQNVVQKLHFKQRSQPDALARTLMRAWDELDPQKLINIDRRWLMVLYLIIEDKGGDRLVEKRRGKLYSEPPADVEDLDVETLAEEVCPEIVVDNDDDDDDDAEDDDKVVTSQATTATLSGSIQSTLPVGSQTQGQQLPISGDEIQVLAADPIVPHEHVSIIRNLVSGKDALGRSLASDEPVVAGGSCSILRSSIMTLKECEWLNDEVMNYFCKNIISPVNKEIRIFSSFFMGALRRGRLNARRNGPISFDQTVKGYGLGRDNHGYSASRDIFLLKALYVPINFDNKHWLHLRVVFGTKRIELRDSLKREKRNHKQNQAYMDDMKLYLFHEYHRPAYEHDPISWEDWNKQWTCHDCSESTPHQDNGDDCGVFTLLAISLLAQGIDVTQSLYSQSMVYRQKCRQRIAYLLWKDGGQDLTTQ